MTTRLSLTLLLLVACVRTASRGPRAPQPMPADRAARAAVLQELGRQLHASLARGAPEQLLFDDAALSRLVDEASATRLRALRVGAGARLRVEPARFRVLGTARYVGVCLQGARQEPAGGPLGLKSQGWVFERALVVGAQPGGRRVASWVEGAFVFTDAGFGALALTRVEPPRWEHSDLELAICDMAVGLH